jgi:hypothetical protein
LKCISSTFFFSNENCGITQVDDSGHRILQERCVKVTVFFRKAPEIAGTWKQYSDRKFFGFFPMISDRFLTESAGSWQEYTGKNPDNFRPEYCFDVPAIPGVFLQDPVTGIFDLGRGYPRLVPPSPSL